MGKINVVRDDGSVVAVDEEDYVKSRSKEHSGYAEDPFDAVQRVRRQERKDEHTGLGYQVASAGLAAADTATAGILGKVVGAVSPEAGQDMQEMLQDNKAGTTIGSLGGVLLPGLGTAGRLAKGGVEAATGSKLAGLAAEGGVIGGGTHVAHSNITGDPISIEGIAEDIGVGGAIGLGFGVVSKGLGALTKVGVNSSLAKGELEWESVTSGSNETPLAKAARARAKVNQVIDEEKSAAFSKQEDADAANYANEEKARKADIVSRKKQYADQLKQTAALVDDMPSWNAAKDAHNGYRTQIRQANAAITKAQAEYDSFASPNGAKKAIGEFEKTQAKLRSMLAETPEEAGQGVQDFANENPQSLSSEGLPADARNKGRYTVVPKKGLPPGASNKGRYSGGTLVDEAPVGPGAPQDVQPEVEQPGGPPADQRSPRQNMTDTLKEMEDAKSAARKAAKAGDWDGVAHSLKAVQPKVSEFLPETTIEFPVRPTQEPKPVPAELPKKLTDLARKHPGSIGKMVAGLDDATVAELDKVATDLGLEPGATPGDTLAYVHKKLHDTFFAPGQRLAVEEVEHIPYRRMDEVIDEEAAAGTRKEEWDAASAEVDAQRSTGDYKESSWGKLKPTPKASSPLNSAIDFTKRLAKYTAGRAADVGGAKGVLFRMMAGEAAGMAMDSVESAVAGSAMTGKVGLRAKIGEAFSGFAKPSQKMLEVLGPVTVSLKQSFPFGHADPTTDERDLVMNRVNDLLQAKVQAPDVLYGLMKGVMGTSGDIAFKLHQQFLRGVQYLAEVAPKDPGINVTMNGSRFRPSEQATRDFSHAWEAIMHPVPYLARVLAGDGSAAGMQALVVGWPALVEEARAEAMRRDWSDLDMKGHKGLSMLYQRPMSGLQEPGVLWLFQGSPQQQMAPQQHAAGPSAGGTAGFGKPGRPAAYDSAPAGSNVSGHVNRQ
jgi:hypothetical protein